MLLTFQYLIQVPTWNSPLFILFLSLYLYPLSNLTMHTAQPKITNQFSSLSEALLLECANNRFSRCLGRWANPCLVLELHIMNIPLLCDSESTWYSDLRLAEARAWSRSRAAMDVCGLVRMQRCKSPITPPTSCIVRLFRSAIRCCSLTHFARSSS